MSNSISKVAVKIISGPFTEMSKRYRIKRLLPILFFIPAFFCYAENPPSDQGKQEEEPLPFFHNPAFAPSGAMSGIIVGEAPPHSPNQAISQDTPRKAIVVEKVTTNLRVYRDNKYREHVRREEQGRLNISTTAVSGRYYIIENAVHNAMRQANRVDETVIVTLPATALLEEWRNRAGAYPRFCPLPFLPSPLPRIGHVWKTDTTIALHPEHSMKAIRLPVTMRYRYEGTAPFNGKTVERVTGFLALQWDNTVQSDDGTHDSGTNLHKIKSNHTFTLFYSSETHLLLFIKDNVEETFTLGDGQTIGYKGFLNHWYSYPAFIRPDRKDKIVRDIGKGVESAEIENVDVAETEEGTTLRINDLRFKPDLAVLLPEERQRVSRIAEIIRENEQGTILVVGHTADIGNPEGQKRLSVERAKRISEMLINNGVGGERVLYEGRGGTEPLAENDTEEGRAQNRRVEIILFGAGTTEKRK